MKKNKIIFCMTLAIFFLCSNHVNALYNGSGGSLYTGSGTFSCNTKNKYCTSDNSNLIIIKAGIYYIDNGTFQNNTPIGGDYYFTDSYGAEQLSESELQLEQLDSLQECRGSNKYKCASEKLREFFGDIEGNPQINSGAEAFLNKATNQNGKTGYLNVLTNESEWANKTTPATKGYRIIIEPMRLYGNTVTDVNQTVLLTPKELANVAIQNGTKQSNGKYAYNGWYIPSCPGTPGEKPNGCNNPLVGIGSFAQVFFTEFKDVGINGESKENCSNVDIDTLANYNNGCGYNIIDISQYTKPPKCYDKKTTGKLECINIDQNNLSTFKEIYDERTCSVEEAAISKTSKYGKKIKEYDNCTLYCIESAFASLPGNISGALPIETISNRGTYFAWPSRLGTPGMTMLMRSKLTCTIVQKKDKTCTAENINNLKKSAESTIKDMELEASLKAGTNKEINEKLIAYNTKYNYTNFDSIKLNEDGISNEFFLEKEAYFKIPNNKNRLYNRESENVFDGTSAISNIIFDRGEGVISLKKSDDVSKIYNLEIYDIKLGSGTFDELISKNDYVCNYQLKIDDCVCPEGTLRAGESLYEELVSGKSCTELQNTSCNICQCPPNSSNEYDIIKIGEDATTEACEELKRKQCYNNYCTYKGKMINLEQCIKTQVDENKLTKEEANVFCEQTLCPKCIDKSGKEIDLSDCLETGNSYTICENLYCKKSVCVDNKCYECSENCLWKLVKKTNTSVEYKKSCSDGEKCDYIKLSCPGGNDNMNNADSCIQKKLLNKLNGNTVTEGLNKNLITNNDVRRAFASCEKEVCPYSGSKIIYRQIDLNDPFPGKNHKGTNNNLKLSNNKQNIRNRIPGENWNSKIVINSKILNARGTKGYELYNKDPLYIIKLTPDIIKKIRDYNKKNSYDDFKLVCTSVNNSANCISDFLHKGIDNLNSRDFVLASYANKNSVNKCYNMSYSESSFNECYNKDN